MRSSLFEKELGSCTFLGQKIQLFRYIFAELEILYCVDAFGLSEDKKTNPVCEP
jgi:hypothetical protein